MTQYYNIQELIDNMKTFKSRLSDLKTSVIENVGEVSKIIKSHNRNLIWINKFIYTLHTNM